MCLGLKPRVHDGRCRRIHGAMVAPLRNQKCWNICSIVNSLHRAFISLNPFTVNARTKRFLCSYINARQCEFVNSSFFNLWTFVSFKIEPSSTKIGKVCTKVSQILNQNHIKMFSKTVSILPKWRNFVKFGHTNAKSHQRCVKSNLNGWSFWKRSPDVGFNSNPSCLW